MPQSVAHHRRTSKITKPPHGREVFGTNSKCDCRRCGKYRLAVNRLVESFSSIPSRWIGELAVHRGEYLALPMWGTLFMPGNSVDVRNMERLLIELPPNVGSDRDDLSSSGWKQVGNTGVLACQFDDELLLGIDGAGYDFYCEHWEPLYVALGYHWHE